MTLRSSSNSSPLARVLALVLASALFGGTAAAEDELVETGIQLRREHRDADALDRFRRAYAVEPLPRTRAQIALAEQALGEWIDAETDLLNALTNKGDRWIASHTELLERNLEKIRRHLGSLVVETNVTPADLWINGRRVGEVPMQAIRVVAGATYVEIRSKGYETIRRSVDVSLEQTVHEHFVLTQIPDPAPPDPSSPPVVIDLAKPKALEVVPSSSPSSPRPNDTQRLLAWGSLGAASAFLGGALVAQVVARQDAARYNDDARCLVGGLSRDERCGTDRGHAEAAQTLATLGYVAAGSLGISSAVLFLTGPSRPKTGGLRIWIDARAASTQVGCTGAF